MLPMPSFLGHVIRWHDCIRFVITSKTIAPRIAGMLHLSYDATVSHIFLGGKWHYQEPTFIFPLRDIPVKPVIYLLPMLDRHVGFGDFYAYMWWLIWEAEAITTTPIPLEKAIGVYAKRFRTVKAIANFLNIQVLDSLPTSAFATQVALASIHPEHEKRGRKIQVEFQTYYIPEYLREFLHEYNQTICKLHNLNYEQVKTLVRNYCIKQNVPQEAIWF